MAKARAKFPYPDRKFRYSAANPKRESLGAPAPGR
jgi:hypothetical protein